MRTLRPFCILALATGFALAFTCCESGDNSTNPVTLTCAPAKPAAVAPPASGATNAFSQIQYFVIIYMENHSFDNLYGEFLGAEGLAQAGNAAPQVDNANTIYKDLPQPVNTEASTIGPDPRFPATLPNAPFPIEQYIPSTMLIPDLVHRWYQEPMQINGGLMNRFAAVSDAKGLSMGYYHTAELPMFVEASNYTLCDHFFHAAFGGSFLNHMWLIAAQSPIFPNAPTSMVAELDSSGNLVQDGNVTPNGCYVVNTSYTVNMPHPSTASPSQLVPNQTFPTIGDRLSAKGIRWKWYSGGWDDAALGNPDPLFQFHHQPFAYFANYADNTPGRAAHLKDEKDMMADIGAGTLPQVTFFKPIGEDNAHPGYSVLETAENHLVSVIDAIRAMPTWPQTAIIVTYDENGGQWDHVPPPKVDSNGPGTRIPCIVISPFAKKQFVDSTIYDTTSILATLEHRYGLDPLTSRDANATDLSNAFDFAQ